MTSRICIDGAATARRRKWCRPQRLRAAPRVIGIVEVQIEVNLLGKIRIVPSRRDIVRAALEGECNTFRCTDNDSVACFLAAVCEVQETGPEARHLVRVAALHRYRCQRDRSRVSLRL